MTLLRTLITTSALLLAGLAQATPIVVGSMSRDVANNSPYIIDSLNNRQWLGWDVTKGLSYAQTVAETRIGGQFAGFSIAHNLDAQLFVDALVGVGNPCTVSGWAFCKQNSTEPLREQLLGEPWDSNRAENLYLNSAIFLSDNGFGQEVGYLNNFTDTNTPNRDDLTKNNEWGSIVFVDSYKRNVGYTIGWLLYRATPTANDPGNNVPEPASLALLGLGALGLAAQRRR